MTTPINIGIPSNSLGKAAHAPLSILLKALLTQLGNQDVNTVERDGAIAHTPSINVKALLDALGEATTETSQTPDSSFQANAPPYPPLTQVTKPNLTTAETAYYLDRKPQTLRGWACHSGSGPLEPKRIGGILAWSTDSVKKVAGV